MLLNFPRTYPLKSPSRVMEAVLCALGLQAKNIKNTLFFVVRNVFFAFDESGKRKSRSEMHTNQRKALLIATRSIRAINEKRRRTGSQAKQIKSLRQSPWAILNVTLLDNIARELSGSDPAHPYRSVPAALAQPVVQQVYGEFQTWVRARKDYKQNPGPYTGMPGMPQYRAQEERSSFEMSLSRTTGKGLPPIGGRQVASNYAVTEFLTADQKAEWDRYELDKELGRILKRSFFPKGAVPTVLRVSFGKGRPRFSVVCDHLEEIDDLSPMGMVYTEALKEAGTRRTKFGTVEQKSPTMEMLVKAARALPREDIGEFAMCDFGITNLAALPFSNGMSGMVISSARIIAKLEHFDQDLTDLQVRLMPARLRELQSQRDKLPEGEKLAGADYREMKKLFNALWADPRMRSLIGKRDRWLSDALKKTASGVVAELVRRQIGILSLGQNKGWKQECEMGTEMNRRFHNLAHGRLLGMLKGQGERKGILALTTEESYTSQSSFANHGDLPVYENQKPKAKHENIAKTTAVGCSPPEPCPRTETPSTGNLSHVFGGKRDRRNRRLYHNDGDARPNRPSTWRPVVHADLNGGYNMGRKLFPWFRFGEGVTFDYVLYWLSPKLGLTPMNL